MKDHETESKSLRQITLICNFIHEKTSFCMDHVSHGVWPLWPWSYFEWCCFSVSQLPVFCFKFRSILGYWNRKYGQRSKRVLISEVYSMDCKVRRNRVTQLRVWLQKRGVTLLTMKPEKRDLHEKTERNTLERLCSVSALLLSIACCIALIQMQLKIQEQQRLISHTTTVCDQMETEILRKIQQQQTVQQTYKQ